MSEIKYNRPRGKLIIDDFKKIEQYNELDLLGYMIALLQAAKPVAEKVIKGKKVYRGELRKQMHDIINLSNIVRGMVGVRMGITATNKALDEIIQREAHFAKKIDKMEMGLAADAMLEKIIQVRLAEEKRRKEREQKRQEERSGASGGQHQKASDQL
jgi:hypothetical protein